MTIQAIIHYTSYISDPLNTGYMTVSSFSINTHNSFYCIYHILLYFLTIGCIQHGGGSTRSVQYSTTYFSAFLYMTVLCCLQFPPPLSGKYIHGGRVGEGKGRGKVYYLFVTKSVHHLVNCFILFYNTLYLITVHLITLYLTIGWYSTYTHVHFH